MSRPFHFAIFDLDGTLLNTERGIVHGLNDMASALGLPPIAEEDYHRFIGPPIEESVRAYFDLDLSRTADAARAFRTAYSERYLFEAEPYEGIYEALDGLKDYGVKLAIATNKRHHYATTVIEHFNLGKYFSFYLGSHPKLRPAKIDTIAACLDAFDADPHRSVYIGDTESDRTAAAQAGIGFIGVTYGFGFDPNSGTGGLAVDPKRVKEMIIQGGRNAA